MSDRQDRARLNQLKGMEASARYNLVVKTPDPVRWDDPGHIEYMAARFIARLSLTKIMLQARYNHWPHESILDRLDELNGLLPGTTAKSYKHPTDNTHFTAYYSPDRPAQTPSLPGQGHTNERNN